MAIDQPRTGAAPLEPVVNWRSRTVWVEAWEDPGLREPLRGFDPRSRYVERFWLPVLGPTATWLIRRLSDLLEAVPEGSTVDMPEMATCLGLVWTGNDRCPLGRSLRRCFHFGLVRWSGPGVLAVRTRMPMLWRRLVVRLPFTLQIEHRDWLAEMAASDPSARRRRHAKLVALDLCELGVDAAAIERHLIRQGSHPAIAFEAARWAWTSEGEVDQAD